jgi:pilus assembly protein Flp/PilA
MSKVTCRFCEDESGATAIEYGLIAAFIAIVLIVSLGVLGNNLEVTFNQVSNRFEDANQRN